ncbi:hypothetical protein BCCH1_77100 (plasmid) [Burkholderia contaminans]|uniref:Uncharacterized protein n=1 Tax=Burkholderia contaminans TaxID=488447 RepID=A0A250LMA4_9BURK|nr:hypothetical protein BCCH1_77100 [Burkholderia contaminans]
MPVAAYESVPRFPTCVSVRYAFPPRLTSEIPELSQRLVFSTRRAGDKVIQQMRARTTDLMSTPAPDPILRVPSFPLLAE